MKNPRFNAIYQLCIIASCFALLFTLAGCMSIPKPPKVSQLKSVTPPSTLAKIFTPAKAAEEQAQYDAYAADMPEPPARASAPAPAYSPVKETIERETFWFWIIAVLCWLGGAACIYLQLYIPAVKLFIAGIALPIFAEWFAYHYILIIAGALIASAVGFLWANRKSQSEIDAFAYAAAEAKSLWADAQTELTKLRAKL